MMKASGGYAQNAAITSPANGQVISQNVVQMSATASHPDGIDWVRFYVHLQYNSDIGVNAQNGWRLAPDGFWWYQDPPDHNAPYATSFSFAGLPDQEAVMTIWAWPNGGTLDDVLGDQIHFAVGRNFNPQISVSPTSVCYGETFTLTGTLTLPQGAYQDVAFFIGRPNDVIVHPGTTNGNGVAQITLTYESNLPDEVGTLLRVGMDENMQYSPWVDLPVIPVNPHLTIDPSSASTCQPITLRAEFGSCVANQPVGFFVTKGNGVQIGLAAQTDQNGVATFTTTVQGDWAPGSDVICQYRNGTEVIHLWWIV